MRSQYFKTTIEVRDLIETVRDFGVYFGMDFDLYDEKQFMVTMAVGKGLELIEPQLKQAKMKGDAAQLWYLCYDVDDLKSKAMAVHDAGYHLYVEKILRGSFTEISVRRTGTVQFSMIQRKGLPLVSSGWITPLVYDDYYIYDSLASGGWKPIPKPFEKTEAQ